MNNASPLLRFASFEVNVEVGEVRRYGHRIKLQDKPFQILIALLERPGGLVSREELHQRLWPGDTFVDFDHNLNNAVDKLRKALNDSAEEPKFIETLPRRGYRFIATMERVSVPAASEVADSARVTEAVPSIGTSAAVLSTLSTGNGASQLPGNQPEYTPEIIASSAPAPPRVPSPSAIEGHKTRFGMPALAGLLLLIAVSAGALLLLRTVRSSQKAGPVRFERLLVLPVQNLTGNPDQDYLSDGLTEEMITRLGKLDASSLAVIAPTTAMRLKQSTKSPADLARQLHVDYALEATLRHSEGRMRISVELIRVADEVQMWAADYEREGKNLFGISNEVALSIGKQLRLHSARRPERTGLGEGTKSSEAYEYYLKGRYFWNRRLKEDVDLAKKYFAKAIEVDPNYARAHAGLADSYIVLAGSHMPAKTAFEKAQECAEKQFS